MEHSSFCSEVPNRIRPHCVFVCCCQLPVQWPLCWELGVSSHSHALICMLSSLKTGTPHCQKIFISMCDLISPSQQIVLELVVRIFSKQLESTSVWYKVSLLWVFLIPLQTRKCLKIISIQAEKIWCRKFLKLSCAETSEAFSFLLQQQQHLWGKKLQIWQIA